MLFPFPVPPLVSVVSVSPPLDCPPAFEFAGGAAWAGAKAKRVAKLNRFKFDFIVVV